MMSTQPVAFSRLASAVLCLTACAILAATSPAASSAANSAVSITVSTGGDYTVWTKFANTAYALLADNAGDLWIAGSNRVVRWDRAAATAEIITVPQHDLFAAASTPDGALWFGGAGGLSRRAPDGTWRHITAADHPFLDAPVSAVAATADGLLYLAMGSLAGPVVRHDPAADTWVRFPNRAAAVAIDYTRLLTMRTPSALWTVQGDRIWVDWWVYDGAAWRFNPPPPGADRHYAPTVTTTDGRLWTGDGLTLYAWDGAQWTEREMPFDFFSESTPTLAADPDGSLWIGRYGQPGSPYAASVPGIFHLTGDSITGDWLSAAGAPMALLATAAGATAVGPGWLWHSTTGLHTLPGMPRYNEPGWVLAGRSGLPYLASGNRAGRTAALQQLDDGGTYRLEDDAWATLPLPGSSALRANVLTASAETPGGSLWVAGYRQDRFQTAVSPLLITPSGHEVSVTPPTLWRIDDIFAGDERHTLFAWNPWFGYTEPGPGVWLLDNRGTPLDTADDLWTDLGPTAGQNGHVARDALGRIWYGSSAGLFRHENGAWTSLRAEPIDELAIAADATVYARFIEGGLVRVAVYHLSGATETITINRYWLPHPERYALLHNIVGHNRIVAHAADGWDWFLTDTEFLRCRPDVCERYPHPGNALSSWSVDGYGRPWIIADGAHWRLSRPPGFALSTAADWFVAPGATAHVGLTVDAWEGFAAPVTVTLGGLPEGVSAEVSPNPAPAGGRVTVHLTAEPTVAPGAYPVYAFGANGATTQSATATLWIGPDVGKVLLPIVRR